MASSNPVDIPRDLGDGDEDDEEDEAGGLYLTTETLFFFFKEHMGLFTILSGLSFKNGCYSFNLPISFKFSNLIQEIV